MTKKHIARSLFEPPFNISKKSAQAVVKSATNCKMLCLFFCNKSMLVAKQSNIEQYATFESSPTPNTIGKNKQACNTKKPVKYIRFSLVIVLIKKARFDRAFILF